MKNGKRHFWAAMCLLLGMAPGAVMAQTDVTAQYLANAGFDSRFDYDVNATGNVAQELLEVDGWTKDIEVDYTISGVYQLGTAKTFNGVGVPATGADGTADGGALALSTGWGSQLKFYQEVTLPAGKYGLVTATYNSGAVTAGSSLAGWIPADGEAVMSGLDAFPIGAWTADTVVFFVNGETKGKIQVGLQSVAGSGSGSTAKILVDYVKLLDYGFDNSALLAVIAEAEALYGDGTGKGSDALKAAIDEATAASTAADATMESVLAAAESLKSAMWNYRLGNASKENPMDMTERILNPSFESGFDHWTNVSMQTQGNNDFTAKGGAYYVEKWVSQGNAVGDASVTQTISGLDNGNYILKAAGQNIQQGALSATQTGAWIFANENTQAISATGEYELAFTLIEGTLTLGFKAEGATGNWMAVDNFRLYYVGNDMSAMQTELKNNVETAKGLLDKKMNASVLATLQTAIANAEAELEKETSAGYAAVTTALKQAIADAEESVDAYAALKSAIEEAQAILGDGTQEGAAELSAAIATAQAVEESGESTVEQLLGQITALDNASFTLRLANATGTVPTVVTHPYIARGATMALGRSTISGVSSSELMEAGFCWSTHPEPTVLDNRTTKYFSQNGNLYHMENLTPATVYYMRAYALTKNYAVGYGEVVKVITIPMGKITWSYNNGGPDEANARINAAVADAVYYWNSLTSISGFHANVNYGADTPTADCSYGGWMRVGPNASYQRTGTILHELGHGIGVGTHPIWYGPSSPLRAEGSRGTWLGERVAKVVQFLENNTTSVLSGDGTHMWPYGVNGAHEDTGSALLYIGNGLITQALGEDGLPPTGGFCTPAYVFEQEDDIKYYIKCEDTNRGLYTSYLVENEKGKLVWKTVSAAEAVANDSCAWYITFTPEDAYYQLRNAATGHYMTYSKSGLNGIQTVEKAVPASAEKFHLMRSRVDAVVGEGEGAVNLRGYWIIHPEATLNPNCLSASAAGLTSTATFDLSDGATTQRWVFLQADELQTVENVAKSAVMGQLDTLLEQLKGLMETPHVEDVEGADATVNALIAELEAKNMETLTVTEISSLCTEVDKACITFLGSVTPSDVNQPFDVSFLISDAGVETNEGWSATPSISYSCAEFFEQSFDYNQTITGLPKGTYQVRVQAFQRPGVAATAYDGYVAGTSTVTTWFYANAQTARINHVGVAAQESRLGGGIEIGVGSPTRYIPNNMMAASKYFEAGMYDNAVTVALTSSGSKLKMGLRCSTVEDDYWTIFDNFRLYYYGSMSRDEVANEVKEVVLPSGNTPLFARPTDVYSITGVCVRKQATTLEGLPAGIYIVGGRKAVVK